MVALRAVGPTEGRSDALVDCELVIERGLKSFVEVGQALATIRDQHLYKDEFATFEDYCRERWDMARRTAYQLIDAQRVCAQLRTLESPLPATESQARELSGLEPGEAQEVMEAAHTASGGRITAKAIREAREEYETQDEPPTPERPLSDQNFSALNSADRTICELLDLFVDHRHTLTAHQHELAVSLLQSIQTKAAHIEGIYHGKND